MKKFFKWLFTHRHKWIRETEKYITSNGVRHSSRLRCKRCKKILDRHTHIQPWEMVKNKNYDKSKEN